MCYGYISGYLSKVREHIQSHCKMSSREQSHSSHKKGNGGKSDSSSDGISSNEEWSAEELEEEEEDNDDDEESGSSTDMRLAQMPQILSRVLIQVSSLLVQTLACHPTSLGVDYQRDGMVCPH